MPLIGEDPWWDNPETTDDIEYDYNPVQILYPDAEDPFGVEEGEAEDTVASEEEAIVPFEQAVINRVFYGQADELFEGRRGKVFDDGHRRDYIRRWRVITTQNRVNPVIICMCPGLPVPWSPYFPPEPLDSDGFPLPNIVDLKAVLVELSCEQEHKDDWQCWVVTGRYSSHPSQLRPTRSELPNRWFGAQNRPDHERPKLRWTTEEMQLAATKDLDGKRYINAANQAFSPPYMVKVLVPVLTIIRNESTVTQKTINEWSFAVNSQPFLDATVGMAQIFSIGAEEFYLGGDEVWYKTEIKIRFAPDVVDDNGNQLFTWQPRLVDAGLCELSTSSWFGTNRPVPILGPGGIPVSQPVLLDSTTGRKKAPEVGGPNDGIILPDYIDFRQYKSIMFSRIFDYGLGDAGGGMILPFPP